VAGAGQAEGCGSCEVFTGRYTINICLSASLLSMSTYSWVLGLLATLSLELSNFYIDTVMNMEYLEYLEKEPWSAFSISKAASSAFTLQDFMRYLNRH